jgi:hypothetical protein
MNFTIENVGKILVLNANANLTQNLDGFWIDILIFTNQ